MGEHILKEYNLNQQPRKLNIGCGYRKRVGWINIDYDKKHKK